MRASWLQHCACARAPRHLRQLGFCRSIDARPACLRFTAGCARCATPCRPCTPKASSALAAFPKDTVHLVAGFGGRPLDQFRRRDQGIPACQSTASAIPRSATGLRTLSDRCSACTSCYRCRPLLWPPLPLSLRCLRLVAFSIRNDPSCRRWLDDRGRAATIYDTNPLYGAFRQPVARFGRSARTSRPTSSTAMPAESRSRRDRSRSARSARLVALPDAPRAHCSSARCALIISRAAARSAVSQSAARTPRRRSKPCWQTPADRQIDDFVRHAVQYGILSQRAICPNMPIRNSPSCVAASQELGAGCPAAET